jgi:hypothetical protein
MVGPQAPDGGRQADPWPEELPAGSRNVPTYHRSRKTPATATRLTRGNEPGDGGRALWSSPLRTAT